MTKQEYFLYMKNSALFKNRIKKAKEVFEFHFSYITENFPPFIEGVILIIFDIIMLPIQLVLWTYWKIKDNDNSYLEKRYNKIKERKNGKK